jgi:hypothetical protein
MQLRSQIRFVNSASKEFWTGKSLHGLILVSWRLHMFEWLTPNPQIWGTGYNRNINETDICITMAMRNCVFSRVVWQSGQKLASRRRMYLKIIISKVWQSGQNLVSCRRMYLKIIISKVWQSGQKLVSCGRNDQEWKYYHRVIDRLCSTTRLPSMVCHLLVKLLKRR